MKTRWLREFSTKREFEKWIEEHLNEIDFDEDVITLEYYLKDED